jgi:hypothetical protein
LEQESEQLLETVQAANELFSHGALRCFNLDLSENICPTDNAKIKTVKSTREAALDARLLLHTTRLASERVHQLKLDTSSFDREEFMRRLRERLYVPRGTAGEGKMNWAALKPAVTKALIRAPSIGFMCVGVPFSCCKLHCMKYLH